MENICSYELVVGDIMNIETGQIMPCDGILVNA